ncbi:MAG: lytic murein transglycosylase [Pseudorhodobacter sp.]
MRNTGVFGVALVFSGGLAAGAAMASPQVVPTGQVTVVAEQAGGEAGFRGWLTGFRARAQVAGIPGAVLDNVLPGLTYQADVIRRDRNQSEFTKTIWDYLDTAVSEERVANGRAALARHRDLLERIEARYGVEKEVVVAIWGLETAYGTFRGSVPTLDALATLAHDGRRGAFFEAELLNALRIVAAGDVAPRAMVGSWAGAMGHTQFMPSSFLALAQDFNGDGRRDIWGDDPTDGLASAAHYLAHYGWTKGMPWGVEVVLPQGFDFEQSGERVRKSTADWQAMGLRGAEGGLLPDHGPASVLLPGGARGAAFLIFANFQVIERYNPADAYVIAVGHLADRIRGAGPFRASWPREERALTRDERLELQERLTQAGFDTRGVDGRIGPNTIAAIRAFQKAQGLVPDGFAALSVLTGLR